MTGLHDRDKNMFYLFSMTSEANDFFAFLRNHHNKDSSNVCSGMFINILMAIGIVKG